jgi:hypothetical protein
MEFFWGACTTRQFGDGGVRFPLGKTKENEGKALKTGRKEENGGKLRKKHLNWRKN